MNEINPMLKAAIEFHVAGYSVIQAKTDGTKSPIGLWKKWCDEQPSLEQVIDWFKDGHQGIGVVTGFNNLECLEVEGRAVASKLHITAKEIAEASGLGELWEKINTGYVEQSPSGGIHWLYRIENPPQEFPGNTKIASRPGENGGVDVLVETRSHHGFIITAPSYGSTHPSGKPWEMIAGSPASIPTITMDERDSFHNIFAILDEMPEKEAIAHSLSLNAEPNGDKPGDDFNARADWREILVDWKVIYTSHGITYWRRPGKNEGISATTKIETGNLYVFTTSTTFEERKPYSKFAAYAHLNFNDDFSAAARDLRFKGYGAISLVQDSPIAPFEPALTEEEMAIGMSADEKEFEYELRKSKIRRDVQKALNSEEALKTYDRFSFIPNLEEEMKLPEEEVSWTIPDLIPTGANVTLTAQYKAGKTTLINNLAMSLADGTSFLNYFKPAIHPGRIVIFNYEVSENQYRRWMKDISIENAGKVTLVHLRGKAVPMISDYVRKEVIETLQSLNCQTWIVDPFARAFTGSGDENSNSDVGVFLDQLDIIKERAGVSNMILPVHTGRAQEQGIERARGATRLDDWADVRWLLKKTDDGRFFSADGRDVLLEEQMLRWDDRTRHLTLGGADARTAKRANLEELWVEAVKKNPGATTGALCQILGKGTDDKSLAAARKSATHYKRVKSQALGSATVWYAADYIPPFQMSVETA
jgi:hypothetical protein